MAAANSSSHPNGQVPQANVTESTGSGSYPSGRNVAVRSSRMTAQQKSNVRFTIDSVTPSTWMSPNQPITPIAPDSVKSRQWDYPIAWNLNYIPRNWEPVKFSRLKLLADASQIVRMCIESRKDQISALDWVIRPKAKGEERAQMRVKSQDRINMLTDFFQSPDKRHDFSQWMSGILEQHFVYDAVALYRRRTRGGQPYAFEQIDAATISPLIDGDGRTPLPPNPAYQQVLKGIPAADYSTYTTGDLHYEIKNFRPDHAYGFGVVEQIIHYVEMTIQRVKQQMSFYTHGDKPQGIMEGAPGLSMDQVTEIQSYWDSIFAGNIESRSRLWWVPAGSKYTPIEHDVLFDFFDEWLARVICYAFSIAPQPFVKETNRATANQSQETAAAEGIKPTSSWSARFVNKLITVDFGITDLEFAWDQSSEYDPIKKATIHNLYVRAGVETIDEVRADLGYDPFGGVADTGMFATMNGYVSLEAGSEIHQQNMDAKNQQMQQSGENHDMQVQGQQQALQQNTQPNQASAAKKPGATQTKPGPGNPGDNTQARADRTPRPTGGGAGTPSTKKLESAQIIKISRPIINEFSLRSWAQGAGIDLAPDLELDEGVHVTTGLPSLPMPAGLPLVLVEPAEMSLSQDGTDLWLNIKSPMLSAHLSSISSDDVNMMMLEPRILLSSTFLGDATGLPPYDDILMLGEEVAQSFNDGLAKATAEDVATAAAQTETSPTDGQLRAGNYKKGHIRIQGLDISIENAEGSVRESRHDKWKAIMPCPYGYINGTKDADGDSSDVFIGPNPASNRVFVIDQVNDDGTFDEHKCFVGYDDWGTAQNDYVKSYADAERATPGKGHHNIGGVKQWTMPEFKLWVYSDQTLEPIFTHTLKAELAKRGYVLAKGYSDDEERDDHGRWTSGGSSGGLVMVSPSTLDNSQWRDAVSGMNTDRQKQFVAAANEINGGLGLQGRVESAVGAWTDGAENSTIQTFAGRPSFDTLKTSAAMQGLIGEQKAAIAFQPDENGKEALYTMTVNDHSESVHDQLLSMGVDNHTLVDLPGGRTKISVLDFNFDDALDDKMHAVGEHYDAIGTVTQGNGAYLAGSDDSSRESGAEAYRQVIAEFESVHGSEATAFFRGVTDRWRGSSAQ